MKALYAANALGFLAALAVAAPDARAHWVSTNGPAGATVRAFTVTSDGLLAATEGRGVFAANASYTAWTPTNSGLSNQNVLALTSAVNSWGYRVLLAGTRGGGIFASFDDGATWAPKNAGLLPLGTVRAIAAIPDDYFGNGLLLLEGGDGGIYRSNNGGYGIWWWPASTGLTSPWVTSLLPVFEGGDPDDGSGAQDVYAGTNGAGVFVSMDGILWIHKSSGLTNLVVPTLATTTTYETVFAGTAGGGVFRSSSVYGEWTPVNDGLTDLNIRALATVGTTIFAGTSRGVFVVNDDGEGAWTAANSGLSDLVVVALASDGTDLFASTASGVFRRPISELVRR